MRALGALVLLTSIFAAQNLGAGTGRELFTLPLECGAQALISQGNGGTFSHSGRARYAYDLDLPRGTPVVAMADGKVIFARDTTKPGGECWDGGDSHCFPYANLVVVKHADGSTTIVKHLDDITVHEGQLVKRGQRLGHSGSTGYSTGPHAHVMRQVACGDADCQSMPLTFVDVAGTGIPQTDDIVRRQSACTL
jgi:murein DD-endopeptidase MepM/ murein hydrolase activator NlpD